MEVNSHTNQDAKSNTSNKEANEALFKRSPFMEGHEEPDGGLNQISPLAQSGPPSAKEPFVEVASAESGNICPSIQGKTCHKKWTPVSKYPEKQALCGYVGLYVRFVGGSQLNGQALEVNMDIRKRLPPKQK